MVPVLEAVPNFSQGCDLDWVRELVGVIGGAGVEVLDWSADPDHNRSGVTFIGEPAAVEAAALAAARHALEGSTYARIVGSTPGSEPSTCFRSCRCAASPWRTP